MTEELRQKYDLLRQYREEERKYEQTAKDFAAEARKASDDAMAAGVTVEAMWTSARRGEFLLIDQLYTATREFDKLADKRDRLNALAEEADRQMEGVYQKARTLWMEIKELILVEFKNLDAKK